LMIERDREFATCFLPIHLKLFGKDVLSLLPQAKF